MVSPCGPPPAFSANPAHTPTSAIRQSRRLSSAAPGRFGQHRWRRRRGSASSQTTGVIVFYFILSRCFGDLTQLLPGHTMASEWPLPLRSDCFFPLRTDWFWGRASPRPQGVAMPKFGGGERAMNGRSMNGISFFPIFIIRFWKVIGKSLLYLIVFPHVSSPASSAAGPSAPRRCHGLLLPAVRSICTRIVPSPAPLLGICFRCVGCIGVGTALAANVASFLLIRVVFFPSDDDEISQIIIFIFPTDMFCTCTGPNFFSQLSTHRPTRSNCLRYALPT